jgi:Rho guanine nucleotide exchange factor 2
MSDFEMDEKDFAADSWSLAVDSSFLQQHKKEVMKQQDVIYGEPTPQLPLPLPSPVCL